MARPSSRDPLDRFSWALSIDGFTRLGFTACDVPGYSLQTKAYPEGGQHMAPRQIIDGITYKPVTLQRGVTYDMSFHAWASQSLQLARGVDNGKSPIEYRKDVKIYHLNRQGQIVKTYTLVNAFVSEYEVASSFASDGDDVLSMEKLVLTYESFTVESTAKDSNPNDVRDIVKRLINRF